MELHILLAGVEFGPYSDDKARELLGDGFLSATDPAKRLDGTDWQPLSAVLGDIAAPAAPIESHAATAEPDSFSPPPAAAKTVEAPALVPEDEPEPEQAVPVSVAAEPIVQESIPAIPEARAPQPTLLAPPAPAAASAPTFSAAPKLQVSVPSRGKKGAQATRTGSLIAKEALLAALGQGSVMTPAAPIQLTATAPVPELVPEPAPPRRRTPVKLGEQPEEAPAPPPARKTIKLTGRISLPGTAPQPEPASISTTPRATTGRPSTAPKLPAAELAKFTGLIARPGDAARGTMAPERSSGPIVLREKRETGMVTQPTRKTIKLTGPVNLSGRITAPMPTPTPPPRAPQTDDDDGPMVMARTRPDRLTPPALETPATATSHPPETPHTATESAPLPSPAEALAESARTTDTPDLTETGDALSASGRVSAELAARRSLKITGSLRQPPPASGPVHLSSSSSESGPLVPLTEASFGVTTGLEPVASRLSPPVPEEDLPPRPPTGKIPVDQMPTEGVMVRTLRRATSKIPHPATPTESLAHESPPRANPPPLPRQPIELPTASVFTAHATPPPVIEPEPIALPTGPLLDEKASPPPAGIAEPVAPPAPPESVVEASAAPAPEAPATGALPRPEKVRLRRPVNLDLSSRAKPQDSGRITLETFSKLAGGAPAEAAPVPVVESSAPAEASAPIIASAITAAPAAVAAEAVPFSVNSPVVSEASKETSDDMIEPALPAAQEEGSVSPPVAALEEPAEAAKKPSFNSALPLNFPKKLEEAPQVPGTKSAKSSTEPSLAWLFYSIVAVGAVSVLVIVYLLMHRAPTEVTDDSTPAVATSVPASAAPPTSAAPPASEAPPSAAPPATTPPIVPASANPPSPTTQAPAPSAPATPPQSPATTSPAPDVQHQSAAFVSDGILKYQKNDLDGSIAAYNQALELDPKSAEAYYNRGIAKAAKNDLDGAIADYSQAIAANPGLADAYYYRGLARHSKPGPDLDGAISDYNQAVQLDPKNPMAFFNRGLIRMQKDDIDGSIVDSSRALELDPHLFQAYYDRGLGRLAKGATDAALDDMRMFCQSVPQDAYTDYARLYIWLIQTRDGQLADANADLSKAMNSGWNGTPDSMVTRLGEYLLGQISEQDLIKASASSIPVKDQGQRCEAWYFIGMRKLVEADKDAAVQALNKCVGTQKTDYCEYILAQEQLRTLNGAATTDSTPPPPRATPVTLPDPGTIAPPTAAGP